MNGSYAITLQRCCQALLYKIWRNRYDSDHCFRGNCQLIYPLDRVYFKSIYTHDPDGHIVELATLGPGFLVDEPEEELGRRLTLPPWLEPSRATIERRLHPIETVDWRVPVQRSKAR
jgi:hypothetical protein